MITPGKKTRFLLRMVGPLGMLHCQGYPRTLTDRELAERRFYRTACGRRTNPVEWASPNRELALRIYVSVCAVCFPDGLKAAR